MSWDMSYVFSYELLHVLGYELSLWLWAMSLAISSVFSYELSI